MTVNGEVAFYYTQARSYITQASLAIASDDHYRVERTAGNISQAAEFILKAMLINKGIKPPQTHKHEFLMNECGKAGIKIPKTFRSISPILYEYESSLRYDFDCEVDEQEVKDCIKIIENIYESVGIPYIHEAYITLSRTVPRDKLQGLSKTTAVAKFRKIFSTT
ncbi:MAG: HEPN domain-containing protein [Clostridiales bacterium]|nr:HEPN domain-containing protein [Clostridiales bacterium]